MTVDFYINVDSQLVHIMEGTGDNLLQEDIDEGYVDYIYYEVFDLGTSVEESDGGMVLTTELVATMDEEEIIHRTLDMMGYINNPSYIKIDR